MDKKLLSEVKTYLHNHPYVKFLIVLLLFLIYLTFSIISFGLSQGILVALLTWAFFVFCTPIADAGVLIDFPVRFLTGLRMIYSEIIVWIIATIITLIGFLKFRMVFDNSLILRLFEHILEKPWPLWSIIILSASGTFMSIYFGDEILDIIASKNRKRKKYEKHISKYSLIIFAFIIVLILVLYNFLLNKLDINIPLI